MESTESEVSSDKSPRDREYSSEKHNTNHFQTNAAIKDNESSEIIKDIQRHTDHAHTGGYVAPEAPDGGYGWVVIVIVFLIHVIVDGAAFGYGVVSNHIKEYYQTSESQATLVGSLQLGFYLLSCPMAGKMVEKFGFRVVCFTGSLVATIGLSTSQLAPNIFVLMLTYGVITGTGFGMMYLSSISAVTLYFEKKRVLATGLATMGSGLGMFAFSAICNFLIEKYDWKNALLILGGITLQGCVLGMLLRPLKSGVPPQDEERRDLLTTETAEESEILRSDGTQSSSKISRLDDYTGSRALNLGTITEKTPPYMAKLKKDIANDYINSLHSLNLGASLHQLEPNRVKGRDLVIAPDVKPRSKAKQRCLRCTSHIVDLTLLKEPIFYIICIANIFVFLGAFIPLKFQVDRAMTFELSPSKAKTQDMATFLVSVSGIASTVGRGSSALLGVRKNTNNILFHNLAVLGAGIVCFFNVFSTTYPLMVVFAVVFTYFFGVYIALSSVVVCEMLGPEAVNNAFALMCMLRGFANIAGGPIAGAAYDVLQDYDVCFYIGGVMVTLGAICFFMLMLPSIQKRSFHHQVRELDIDVDVNTMIASMTNVHALTDQDRKLYVSSCVSVASAASGHFRAVDTTSA